jgi:hypothetical protein
MQPLNWKMIDEPDGDLVGCFKANRFKEGYRRYCCPTGTFELPVLFIFKRDLRACTAQPCSVGLGRATAKEAEKEYKN